MRALLVLALYALGACKPVCPPCRCGEDMPRPQDLAAAADLSCEGRIGASCVDLPCCASLQCVGGACASVTAR